MLDLCIKCIRCRNSMNNTMKYYRKTLELFRAHRASDPVYPLFIFYSF